MSKVWVAGHRGLVGSAIARSLKCSTRHSLFTIDRQICDLASSEQVNTAYKQHKPDILIICAAKVGGIIANQNQPVPFLLDNLKIQNNLIEGAAHFGVQRVIFLGSSCIYPRDCPQPMREEHLLSGPLEPTNRPYALAKIAGIELCRSYNRQFGKQFLAVMPTNLYGPGDNYHPEHSHVIPGLINKFHQAKINNSEKVVLWGTGSPLREFMYSDDLATAILKLIDLDQTDYQQLLDKPFGPIVNLGSGFEVTISQLAEQIKQVIGYEGDICFDSSYPDGTPRKRLDVSLMQSLGIKASTSLTEGLKLAYADFKHKLAVTV